MHEREQSEPIWPQDSGCDDAGNQRRTSAYKRTGHEPSAGAYELRYRRRLAHVDSPGLLGPARCRKVFRASRACRHVQDRRGEQGSDPQCDKCVPDRARGHGGHGCCGLLDHVGVEWLGGAECPKPRQLAKKIGAVLTLVGGEGLKLALELGDRRVNLRAGSSRADIADCLAVALASSAERRGLWSCAVMVRIAASRSLRALTASNTEPMRGRGGGTVAAALAATGRVVTKRVAESMACNGGLFTGVSPISRNV